MADLSASVAIGQSWKQQACMRSRAPPKGYNWAAVCGLPLLHALSYSQASCAADFWSGQVCCREDDCRLSQLVPCRMVWRSRAKGILEVSLSRGRAKSLSVIASSSHHWALHRYGRGYQYFRIVAQRRRHVHTVRQLFRQSTICRVWALPIAMLASSVWRVWHEC